LYTALIPFWRKSCAVVAIEELLHHLLKFDHVSFGCLDGFCDLSKTHCLVGFRGAVKLHLVTVLLNGLAAVLDLSEAKRGRGSLEKVSEARKLFKLLSSTTE
jgi:hypothetical protein